MIWSDTSAYNGVMQIFEEAIGLGYGQITSDTDAKKRAGRYLNRAFHDISLMILNSACGFEFDDVNWANRDFILTFNTTAGTDYINLALLTNKVLKIRKVETTYDGTNWVPVRPMSVDGDTDTTDATGILNAFSQNAPYYQQEGTFLYIRPTPTASVTGGVKVWVTREIKEYTVTTDDAVEPGIDEPFHEYIGIRAALKYAVFHGLADRKADLMTLDNDCQGRLKEHYSSKNSDRRVTAMIGSFSHYK